MDKNRLWLIGAALAMVVIVALGWFLGVQPQLAASEAADQARHDVQAQNDQYDAALVAMRKDEGNRDSTELILAQLKQSVPYQLDYARFLGELNTFALQTGLSITSVTASDPQAYAPPAAEAAPAADPAADTTADASGDAAETPAPAPAPSDAPIAPAPVTNPEITPQNFVAVPVQVAVRGGYDQVMAFVAAAQHGPRLFLVNTLTTAPDSAAADPAAGGSAPAAGQITGTLGGFIYVLIVPDAHN